MLILDRDPKLGLYLSQTNQDRIIEFEKGKSAFKFEKVLGPGLSIVILNLNKPQFIIPLLDQLLYLKSNWFDSNFEIIVGDTGSTDELVLDKYEKIRDQVKIISDLKYHFSKCNNFLAKTISYDSILFLNNDIKFQTDQNALLRMFHELHASESLGAVGPYLIFDSGELQHGGIEFIQEGPLRGLSYHSKAGQIVNLSRQLDRQVFALTGAFLMIKADAFYEVNGFDEGYEKECQDVALCLSMVRLGYCLKLMNVGKIVHYENGTRPKLDEHWPDRQRFLRKWGSFIEVLK